MTAELTLDQTKAMAGSRELLQLVDPSTKAKYVLVPCETYDRLVESTLDPRQAYRAIEQSFADGWADAKLDDYDRYEEHRK